MNASGNTQETFVRVLYEFPKGLDPERQGKILAIGQTVGSISGDTSGRFASYQGILESVSLLPNGRGQARVLYPAQNVSGDLGSLLVMILGKYSLAGPVRIVSLELPPGYGTKCRTGFEGIRERVKVTGRPLFMGIFKPALGLSPDDLARILRDVGEAGLDLIKDDEILPDTPASTAISRMEACRPVLEEIERARGRAMLYAVTLSGRADRLLDQAKRLRDAGANAYLLSPFAYGLSVMEALASHPDTNLPIFAHPAMAGALSGSPDYGFDMRVLLGTLMVHGGADAVLYPTSAGNLPIAPETERGIRDILQRSDLAPVPSAGVHPGALPRFLPDGDTRIILNAGTGVMDHPGGPAAGVRAFFEAWERMCEGSAFTLETLPDGPLKEAIVKWGT
jgi:2,3-diketo-5-methylthiopentyl-1-phosphate enolase